MEHLLSVAFDNLACFDGPKIKKGLRQIEGLLAQVCLSAHHAAAAAAANKSSPTTTPSKSSRHQQSSSSSNNHKFSLGDLSDDAAFREFFKLQDGFQWNIATRLIQTLDKLYAKSDDGSLDTLMLSALDSLQGVLLLHPSSRNLFSRAQSMNLLLDLLEPINCPAIQSATLLVLVVALLDTPRNTRAFEQLDGLLTVSSIFKSRSTARDVKFKTMEFLYFYLMPEQAQARPSSPYSPSAVSPSPRQHDNKRRAAAVQYHRNGAASSGESSPRDDCRSRNNSPSKLHVLMGEGEGAGGGGGGGGAAHLLLGSDTLSTERKQRMLGEHLANVDDLVRDLQQYTPFVAAGGGK